MDNRCDIIVIGGGLGGLTTAAILATEGLKVRLFERHCQAGGYATTFFKDRFEFEVALHELSGIGTAQAPGPLRCLFEALGLLDTLSFIPASPLYRSIAPGLDVTVPPGAQEAKEALIRAFPSERQGIESLFRRILAIGYEGDLVKATGARPSPARALSLYPNLAHAAGVPLSDVLYREIRDPAARLALAQLWSYFGLPPTRLSFLLYALAMSSYLRFGGSLIREKSQALADALVAKIQKEGSTVSLSHGVSRILSEDGRVLGVISDRQEEVLCKTVISNVSPLVTCNELIDPELIDSAYHDRLAFGEPSLSSVSLYLGLSKPSRDLGIEQHEIYLSDTLDMEAQYEACLSIRQPLSLSICAFDVENPDFCPPGSGVVSVSSLSDGAAWNAVAANEYPKIKLELGRQMLARLEASYPKVAENIETAVVATPWTNMRYTNNPHGAIYGFANTPEHNPGFRLDNKGPLEGLWFVGAWTQPSGGYQGVISSGHKVADSILANRGADRVVPREMDIAAGMLESSFDSAKPHSSRFFGYKTLARNLKRVAKTVKTKYQIPDRGEHPPHHAQTVSVLAGYRALRRPMRVQGKTKQTPDTVVLRLEPASGAVPTFYAGQYLEVSVDIDGTIVSRPYSISSPPDLEDYLEITVKKKESGFVSRYLVDQLEISDVLNVAGPDGDFFFNPLRDTDDLIGLAMGIGITPFMSIIEDLARKPRPPRFTLFYGSKTKEDIIFHHRLEQLEKKHPWLDVVFVLSRPAASWTKETGRIDDKLLVKHLAGRDLDRLTFFVCGRKESYESILASLRDLGVPRARIRLESYGPPEDVTKEKGWPRHVSKGSRFEVRISGLEGELSAAAGEPLLSALERAGLTRDSLCRSNTCNRCRMRLLKGEVFEPGDPVSQRKPQQGFINLCVAHPLSNVLLCD